MNNEVFYRKIGSSIHQNNPTIIGTICLWKFSENFYTAELGCKLLPEYHGKGIMSEAVNFMLKYGCEVLNLQKIDAFTHRSNVNSIRLLQKSKFILNENRIDENIQKILFLNSSIHRSEYPQIIIPTQPPMTWKEILEPIKNTEYYEKLWQKVEEEYSTQKCFPPKDQIFRALDLTPFEKVKVVIIGQDPYHNDLQANGLCFSVSEKVATPPSLKNIFKELKEDVQIERTKNELDDWANQGVLLLNASLTVRAHSPNSHKNLGWGKFTDFIIQQVSEKNEAVVFVLWGAFAQKKEILIDASKHMILKSVHPSPLSVYRGFYGSKPFSKINDYLNLKNRTPISW